jgi:hypothetical protein
MGAHPPWPVYCLFTVQIVFFPGVGDMNLEEPWHSKLLLKVKNFMWLAIRNIIQTADNLGRKNWKGSKFCQLCNSEKSVDHMIFPMPYCGVHVGSGYGCLNWSSISQSVMGFREKN